MPSRRRLSLLLLIYAGAAIGTPPPDPIAAYQKTFFQDILDDHLMNEGYLKNYTHMQSTNQSLGFGLARPPKGTLTNDPCSGNFGVTVNGSLYAFQVFVINNIRDSTLVAGPKGRCSK